MNHLGGNLVEATVRFLDTPKGEIFKTLLDIGLRPYLSLSYSYYALDEDGNISKFGAEGISVHHK